MTTVSVPAQGTYTLDTTTGVVRFVPVLGYAGTATPADYQVTDAYGQTASSTYTPTVAAPAGPSASQDLHRRRDRCQSTTLAIPASGSVTLLSNGSPVSTITVAGEGAYILNAATGVVSSTPFSVSAAPRRRLRTE